jgi:hypothetical protein
MPPIRIDKRLNLVVPITQADGSQIFVHSAPISADIFHAHYKPMAKALSAIYASGTGLMAARIAHLALKDAALELGVWDGPGGVERGLIAEIHRLTNVLATGKDGWEALPYGHAKASSIISPDEADEIEGAICFFTLGCSLHRRAEAESLLKGASQLWGAQIESLNSTEYMNFLRTSTAAGSTGVTAAA